MSNSTRGLWVGRTATQPDPHRALASAIVLQAVIDARLKHGEAYQFLSAGGYGLLDELGLDPAAVLRATERRNRQQEP